jgi:hypothetical protein
VNFVGWVERRARNPSNPVPAVGPRWVSLSLNPSYGETSETRKNPGAATRAGTKKTALFDMVNRKRRERCSAHGTLDRIASAATHSVSAEGAPRRA